MTPDAGAALAALLDQPPLVSARPAEGGPLDGSLANRRADAPHHEGVDMTQAPEIARPAGGPPAGATGGGPGGARLQQDRRDVPAPVTSPVSRVARRSSPAPSSTSSRRSRDRYPYPHEMNDALVKAWLALDPVRQGPEPARRSSARRTSTIMRPVNKRMGQLIAATGEKEIALEAVAGWSPCHHHLVVTGTEKLAGRAPLPVAVQAWCSTPAARSASSTSTSSSSTRTGSSRACTASRRTSASSSTISPWQEDGMVTISVALAAPPRSANLRSSTQPLALRTGP